MDKKPGKAMDKKAPLDTIGGNVKYAVTIENSMDVSKQNGNRTSI